MRSRSNAMLAASLAVAVCGCASGKTDQRLATSPEALPKLIKPLDELVDDGPVGMPKIWAVSIGVSDYSLEELTLEYADDDARAFHGFWGTPNGTAVPDSRRVLLVDEMATRGNILDTLAEVARRVAEEDMLVVYLALHGLPDEHGELYYLAHDTDPNKLLQTGIPQQQLEYVIKTAKAKHIMLVADACHSGTAGLGDFGKRGLVLSESHRLQNKLAQARPGVVLLTASRAEEQSNEGEQWGGGHGAFTYHLLEGMSGLADFNEDGFISISEVFDHVYEAVSRETEATQHPELKGKFQNNLPIAQVPGK